VIRRLVLLAAVGALVAGRRRVVRALARRTGTWVGTSTR